MSATEYFTSGKNYLKRHPASGKSTMLGPNTSAYGGLLYVRTTTIPHNLGFVPMFRAYYEPYGDGNICGIETSRTLGYNADNLNTSVQGPGMICWADSTNLYIQLYYTSAAFASNSYPIYYVIWEDFSL